MSERQTAISRLGAAASENFGGIWVNASDVREAMHEISALRRVADAARAFVKDRDSYAAEQGIATALDATEATR